MAKSSSAFTCTACGAAHKKWAGRCDACGEWNSIIEEAPLSQGPGRGLGAHKGRAVPLSNLSTTEPPPPRSRSGMEEFDRVLGGGLVPGSALLVGGDPGIGKSTLLLQHAAALSRTGRQAIYFSGEEASAQVRMRAMRLGLADAPMRLGAETNLRDILTTLEAERPDLAVIDSIQTLWSDTIEAAPGSVAQVRASAHELVTFAKRRGVAVILVGHVTKEGQIAGPRVVEHMVDCVLYFEGERGHQFRILRSVKNRFGPSGEIGVFEMTGSGLAEVANPSALFLSERGQPIAGSAVFAGIEGTRPVLTEVQALVAPSTLASPRRTVVGLDPGRVSTILAVLEARCGIPFAGLDVFLNVAGGMKVVEPAADLAIAGALLSAREDSALPPEAVLFGEISLSGALRPVGQAENRLKEAQKLGFTQAILPAAQKVEGQAGMAQRRIADLTGFVGEVFGAG
ncbi:DNA repair protein RadA [Paracoccus bogoriensis]|uniref:DNA repair protein RadA n=1 Tax=Paracoccus bogoriensis TaxID=242065 RepID=UPI001CA53AD7|nr:DNA repair protein RadA [Paracoccus bogoriensis]MBW7056270.1 DNA repair protein RadA [Paracoccus bogoriensis]